MAGLGLIGKEQLEWLEQGSGRFIVKHGHRGVCARSAVDGLRKMGLGHAGCRTALALLKRFGSVTVLNGHIHQVLQKVEGKVVFHTARSTAFPQSEPGKGTPGPIRDLAAGRLRDVLGVTTVGYAKNHSALAIADPTLGS